LHAGFRAYLVGVASPLIAISALLRCGKLENASRTGEIVRLRAVPTRSKGWVTTASDAA
jgi:hypothetical protein